MATDTPAALRITRPHLRRLRQMWRSAGWPCQDLIEAELLSLQLLERLAFMSRRASR